MDPEAAHERRVERLTRALSRATLTPGEPFDCPYLPDREARQVVVATPPLAPGAYHALMDLNFRRLGSVFYRPACAHCDACRMLRMRADRHRPNRSQRRCLKRNADLEVAVGEPRASDEKLDLYQRYLEQRHDGRMRGSREEFLDFLYGPAAASLEVTYRLDGALVGVGLADVEPLALSAIYCYYDARLAARALGVFNVLWLLAECRRRRAPFLYLGYFVAGSRTMAYKASFGSHELLGDDGRWHARAADFSLTREPEQA